MLITCSCTLRNLPKPVVGEYSLDDSKRLCVLILEKALKQLPEGQDTVLGVFDLRGFKQRNGDLGFAAFLVSSLLVPHNRTKQHRQKLWHLVEANDICRRLSQPHVLESSPMYD